MNRNRLAFGRALVAAVVFSGALAAAGPTQAQQPVTKADWDQAFKYSSSYLREFIYSTSVSPNWIGESDEFWYSYQTASGKKWWRVNAAQATKTPLFDYDIMTAKLSELSHKPLEATDLPLTRERVNNEGTKLTFVTEGYDYEFDLTSSELKQTGKAQAAAGGRGGFGARGGQRGGQRGGGERGGGQRGGQQRGGRGTAQGRGGPGGGAPARAYSPDRTKFAYVEDGNLFFGEVVGAKPLTEEEQAKAAADAAAAAGNNNDNGNGDGGDQAWDGMDDYSDQDWFDDDTIDANGDGIPDYMQDGQNQDQQDTQQQQDDTQQGDNQQDNQGRRGRGGRGRGNNESTEEVKTIQLTKDSEENYGFRSGFAGRGGGNRGNRGGRGGAAGRGGGGGAVNWSKDSKSFYATRSDGRGIQELYLVDSLNEPRPRLQSYGYPMPGEDAIRKSELYVFHPERKELLRVIPKWRDESYSQIEWGTTSDTIRFMRRDRLLRNAEYVEYNIRTGESKPIISEGFEAAYLDMQPVRYLEKSGDILWWSERSGWGHFYLYSRDGELKNAVTSGPYRASSVVAIDEDNRLLYFRGNAREPNENVYHEHLYCVRFDGSDLRLMDPGDANHSSSLSPSKKYVVDTCSRTDMAPVSILRDSSGKEIMKLEEMDTSRLEAAGWRMPEAFTVKAADGVTDLYGNMWKPFNFDPKKKYPIIAHVYPGPQTEGTTHTFSATSGNQQLAQLGFIVIQVGHRGGTPTRGKAYHSYGYFNLRDYGLEDKKFAIEGLGAKYPYIDTTRVGIYGHSGGGFMSAAALMSEPYNDFFKVAVASAGNHDNNIYNNSWSERYHGLKEVRVEEKKEEGDAESTEGGANRNQGDGDQTDQNQNDDGGGAFIQDDSQDGNQDQQDDKKQDDAKKNDAKKDDGDDKKDDEKKDDDKSKTEEVKTDSDKTEEVKAEGLSEEEAAAKAAYESKLKDALDDIAKVKFEIDVPSNVDIAGNLKGHLLLVHGDMDNNVHPGNTIRLVDALIKANKRFDMLMIPGKAHGFGDAQAYFTQRMWEYFAEHLLEDYQDSSDIYTKDGHAYRN